MHVLHDDFAIVSAKVASEANVREIPFRSDRWAENRKMKEVSACSVKDISVQTAESGFAKTTSHQRQRVSGWPGQSQFTEVHIDPYRFTCLPAQEACLQPVRRVSAICSPAPPAQAADSLDALAPSEARDALVRLCFDVLNRQA